MTRELKVKMGTAEVPGSNLGGPTETTLQPLETSRDLTVGRGKPICERLGFCWFGDIAGFSGRRLKDALLKKSN